MMFRKLILVAVIGLFGGLFPASAHAAERPFNPRSNLYQILALDYLIDNCAAFADGAELSNLRQRFRVVVDRHLGVMEARAIKLKSQSAKQKVRKELRAWIEEMSDGVADGLEWRKTCDYLDRSDIEDVLSSYEDQDYIAWQELYAKQTPVFDRRIKIQGYHKIKTYLPDYEHRTFVAVVSNHIKKDPKCTSTPELSGIKLQSRERKDVRNVPPFVLPPITYVETWTFQCGAISLSADLTFSRDSDAIIGRYLVE